MPFREKRLSEQVAATGTKTENADEMAELEVLKQVAVDHFDVRSSRVLRFNRSAIGGKSPGYKGVKLSNTDKAEFRKKWASAQHDKIRNEKIRHGVKDDRRG